MSDSDPPQPGAADPLIGRVVPGRFELLELIGQGGFGAFYRTLRSPVGREVAVKVMAKEHAAKAVEDRYPNAGAMLAQLRAWSGQDISADVSHPPKLAPGDPSGGFDDTATMGTDQLPAATAKRAEMFLKLAQEQFSPLSRCREGRVRAARGPPRRGARLHLRRRQPRRPQAPHEPLRDAAAARRRSDREGGTRPRREAHLSRFRDVTLEHPRAVGSAGGEAQSAEGSLRGALSEAEAGGARREKPP